MNLFIMWYFSILIHLGRVIIVLFGLTLEWNSLGRVIDQDLNYSNSMFLTIDNLDNELLIRTQCQYHDSLSLIERIEFDEKLLQQIGAHVTERKNFTSANQKHEYEFQAFCQLNKIIFLRNSFPSESSSHSRYRLELLSQPQKNIANIEKNVSCKEKIFSSVYFFNSLFALGSCSISNISTLSIPTALTPSTNLLHEVSNMNKKEKILSSVPIGDFNQINVVFTGESDGTGQTVAYGGDVNKDGFPDFLIGAPTFSSNAGRVFLVFGGSTFPSTISLGSSLGNRGVIFLGETSSQAGFSIAFAGDVNKDGFSDILIGAPFFSTTAGRAYLVYGKASFPATVSLAALGTGGVTFTGASQREAGASVSFVGDLNNDGFSDFIIGALRFSGSFAGRGYMVYGSASFSATFNLGGFSASNGFMFTGQTVNNYAMRSVAFIGDVNNDQKSDFIIGADGYSSNTGRAYVVFGNHPLAANWNTDLGTLGTAGIILTGEETGSQTGFAVGRAGDVNGDEIDDFLVGAPGFSTNTGRVYLIYGSSSIPNSIELNALGSTGVQFTGEPSSRAGISVSYAGDVNSDGYDDILIGASSYSSNTGRVYLIYGQSSLPASIALATLTTEGIILTGLTGSLTGSSVTYIGDTNQDGVDDFLIGAAGGIGTVYLAFGRTINPTGRPSSGPSSSPSENPSSRPSGEPTSQPIASPTSQPSSVPSITPTTAPTVLPSSVPTTQPTTKPSTIPSALPSTHPSSSPSILPSAIPSGNPSSVPSAQPSAAPSSIPSFSPTTVPTVLPSSIPSSFPSIKPTTGPSSNPSNSPSSEPSCDPSSLPTAQPSSEPTIYPSSAPSTRPSNNPSSSPTMQPSAKPSSNPTLSPSAFPSISTSSFPSVLPSTRPSSTPSNNPSAKPSPLPSTIPSTVPTSNPSLLPSAKPSTQPSGQPSVGPTGIPTLTPTSIPSNTPSTIPTNVPTAKLTSGQSRFPSLSSITSTNPVSLSGSLFPSQLPSLILDDELIITFNRSFIGWKITLSVFGTVPALPSNSQMVPLVLETPVLGRSHIIFGSKGLVNNQTKGFIDLDVPTSQATVPIAKITPSFRRDTISRTVLMTGDVNQDDIDDVLYCYPFQSSNSNLLLPLTCKLYFGNKFNRTQFILGVTIISEGLKDRFGFAINSLQDLNQDSHPEIIICAWYKQCTVLYSRRDWNASLSLSTMTGSDGFKIKGDASITIMGLAVTGVHDFNGDHIPDLAISTLSTRESYVLFIIYGQVVTTDISIGVSSNTWNGVRIMGERGAFTGLSVTGIKDFNNDGYSDLAIGVIPFMNHTITPLQSTVMVLGRASFAAIGVTDLFLPTAATLIIKGGGFILTSPGDLNRDGVEDLLITTVEDDFSRRSNGYIVTYPVYYEYQITNSPSSVPSSQPTSSPPSSFPSSVPTMTTVPPTKLSTSQPSYSLAPTIENMTYSPTISPTPRPTTLPRVLPTRRPTHSPTLLQTSRPSTSRPTLVPTPIPTHTPTISPTTRTSRPSTFPTMSPTINRCPTSVPSLSPTLSSSNPSLVYELTDDLLPTTYPDLLVAKDSQSFRIQIIHSTIPRVREYHFKARNNTIMTGGLGRNIYMPFPLSNVSITITNFQLRVDRMDFSQYNTLASIEQLSYRTSPFTILLSQGQQIIFLNQITFEGFAIDNFIFSTSASSSLLSSSSSSSSSSSITTSTVGSTMSTLIGPGLIAVFSVVGALVILTIYFSYVSLPNKIRADRKKREEKNQLLQIPFNYHDNNNNSNSDHDHGGRNNLTTEYENGKISEDIESGSSSANESKVSHEVSFVAISSDYFSLQEASIASSESQEFENLASCSSSIHSSLFFSDSSIASNEEAEEEDSR